jgi:hypothetical protein
MIVAKSGKSVSIRELAMCTLANLAEEASVAQKMFESPGLVDMLRGMGTLKRTQYTIIEYALAAFSNLARDESNSQKMLDSDDGLVEWLVKTVKDGTTATIKENALDTLGNMSR